MGKKMKEKKSKRPIRKTVERIVGAKHEKLADKARQMSTQSGIWNAQVKGDEIAGEVMVLDEKETKYGMQKRVVLKTETKGLVTVFGSTILNRCLEENAVEVGDTIAIAYHGTVPSGKGRPARLFTLAKE